MLNLISSTSPAWIEKVRHSLDELLIDHAHCEKKAAGTAMNLIFAYVDTPQVVDLLTPIVHEELEHFTLVLDLLKRRGIRFRRLSPSSYGRNLHELIRKHEPERAVDRLLVAGLIEARSCERFSLLSEKIDDAELAEFFGSLFESEARHHSSYVEIARQFAPADEVRQRLEELARQEGEIIDAGDPLVRMHS